MVSAADGPRYPDVSVQLTGEDGNAMAIIAKVRKALREDGGADGPTQAAFVAEAMSGDYDNVLATAMRWVEVS